MRNPSMPADIARPPDSWAEVRARGHVVRYRRSGSGRTVLVVASPDHPDAVRSELLDVLAAGFRLIVPEPPATEEDVPCWLSSFLEGLGIPSVRVLTAGSLCVPVLQLALLEGEQIAGVVLIAEHGEMLEPALRELTVPVLVVDPSRPADEVVPVVAEFLRGG
jgi:hypothetical protein